MAVVIEINDARELEDYRLSAGALLATTPDASYLHTVDWLQSYWKHYGKKQKLRVLVVRAAQQTIGIVPFVIRKHWSPLGSVRTLTLPQADQACWFGPLGGDRAATLTLALRHIDSTRRDWDMLDLPGVDLDGADRGRTMRAIKGVGWRPTVKSCNEVSKIDFTSDCFAYVFGKDSDFSRELLKVEQQLQKQERLEFIRHRPAALRDGGGDPRWDLYNECRKLSTSKSERKSYYLRDAHETAARQGAVDLCVLKQAGRVVAFSYSYCREGRLIEIANGASSSVPGADYVLMRRMVESSFASDDVSLHLGQREDDFIHQWRTKAIRPYRLCYVPLGSVVGQMTQLPSYLAKKFMARLEPSGTLTT